MGRSLLVTILVLAVCGSGVAAQNYSYVDLVNMMLDMERISVLPAQGEVGAQWSSYDRASRYDAETDTYVKWDANADGHGIIRMEGDSQVFAEIEGPGVIWRIWSATAAHGHVKIFLDGADEPAVDLPFHGYFDRLNYPFVFPSLAYTVAQGKNLYIPIPFQESCKIIGEPNWGAYYHFTYTQFPKGTTVPTFTRDLSREEDEALRRVDSFLRVGLGGDPAGRRDGEVNTRRSVNLSPGQETTIAHIKGERAVTGIRVLGDLAAYDPETWRNLILRIYWDGEKTPSVWVPLGDFFGSAPGLNNYKSLPMGVTDDLLYSYWYMPFAKEAVIELVNESKQRFQADFALAHAPLTRPADELGRFHVKWHRGPFAPEDPELWIDWPMLITEGRGRYVGVMLEVWNPKGGWWGEGDEKFFVDGEKFPSTFGTGSEDYFGYAWCDPSYFQTAFHNQPRNDMNKNHISNNRWHIADNIPFQTSFDGYMEKYFPDTRPTLYAATAYWYLASGGVDPYKPVSVRNRHFYIQSKPYGVPGAIEGESLEVLDLSGGHVQLQTLYDHGISWSEDTQLWWIGGGPGEKLSLAIPVEESGRYEFNAQLTQAVDYAIVQLYLNGRVLGEPIDLYQPGVTPTGELSFGVHELTKGEHVLTVEIIGANEQAIPAYMFGLDYVKLVKTRGN